MVPKYGVDTDEFDKEVCEAAAELVKQQEESKSVTFEDINFVLLVMVKEAPHDKQSIKQLFLGMLSAFTKLPSITLSVLRMQGQENPTFSCWWQDTYQRCML